MSFNQNESKKVSQSVKLGESANTVLLDASTTESIITFSSVVEKVSFQGSGDLTGNVTFSLDGQNFKDSTAIGAANAIVSFTSHNFRVAKVTRTGGSGKLTFSAK